MAADEKWYFTREQLTNTPSRKCGIDADKELSYRQQAANFIQDMGQRLEVTQLCINTAIVYMHRFYVFHSLSQFHRNAIAAAALFLAAKVEEQPRKLEHVIKMAHMCLHRGQPPPDVRSEQYLEQAQDLVFNENVLLQTLGFDVAIDHPHTHVVRCCQLVKASKDLAQTSYFMASNSLHLTTMCLQYKPTVVACFCIHLACKWSNWEIPQSNEGKHWFWYVDKAVTSELLQQLTAEFLHIFDKCPSRLKRKIMSISANQSPSMNHPSLPNSPFDAEPRKVQSPATTTDGGPTFHSNRPHHVDKQQQQQQQDEKKGLAGGPGRPPVDYREYREKKERERLEREKAAAVGSLAPSSTAQGHIGDANKHHHHKPVSNVPAPGKHPMSLNQKTALHHNHHHRPEVKVGQPVPQRHSTSGQPGSRDPNRQRIPREYSVNNASSASMHAHAHGMHQKDASLEPTESTLHRSELGLQDAISHGNSQEKLSNNNHSIHRLSGSDKHAPHEKRAYDPRHKPLDHRKESEQKIYPKYPDPSKVDRQRKSDTLEQRCEEVRKLIEKPLPPPKPTLDPPQYAQKAHHAKYVQEKAAQSSSLPADSKLSSSGFPQDRSPTQFPQKSSSLSKSMPSQHSAHGVSQILKDTIKNGSSQPSCLTTNIDDPKAEKRPRHDDLERVPTELPQNLLQTPPGKHKSLFSPEKVPSVRESHSQRPKSKQKTPPSAMKVPKQDRLDVSANINMTTLFASPSAVHQQQHLPENVSVKRSASDVSAGSHKRHRTTSNSESEQQQQMVKLKFEDQSSFETLKLLGNTRVPDLIQPIRDNPTNGRSSSVANDLKPPELIKPFEPEPLMPRYGSIAQHQVSVMNQQTLTNGVDTSIVKQEPKDYHIKRETHSPHKPPEIAIKTEKIEYLSPMKSAQSISALLQEPLAPMPSLLQGVQQQQQIGQVGTQQVGHHLQEQIRQSHQQQLSAVAQIASQIPQEQPQQQHQQMMVSHSVVVQDTHVQSQCLPSTTVSGSTVDTSIVSTVDVSVFSLQNTLPETGLMIPAPVTSAPNVPPVEEKRSEHHKSEKKKKKEKHKHKDKEKTKEKHKHKHKDKDKERHREREKEKATEEALPAKPIKITIPKDKLNLGSDGAATCVAPLPEKNKSPQSTGLKIKIPKERLKGAESVSSSPIQPVQAPLKIKIRTDGISRSSSGVPLTSASSAIQAQVMDFGSSEPGRKREREMNECGSTMMGSLPPTKKTSSSQMSSVGYGQQQHHHQQHQHQHQHQHQQTAQSQHRTGERQNGRHYSSSSGNKEKHSSSHHKSSSKLSQSHAS